LKNKKNKIKKVVRHKEKKKITIKNIIIYKNKVIDYKKAINIVL
jgi:hypothetical protein